MQLRYITIKERQNCTGHSNTNHIRIVKKCLGCWSWKRRLRYKHGQRCFICSHSWASEGKNKLTQFRKDFFCTKEYLAVDQLIHFLHFQVATALNNGQADIAEKQEETSQAIAHLTSGLLKASTDSRDGMTQLTTKIGTTQAKLASSIDTVVDSLNHIQEELGGNGVKLEDGLGGLTDISAFLDSLTQNLKSLDSNGKEGMGNLVTALQENSKNLVKSVVGVGVELHEVGDHMKEGQDSIAAEIKAGQGMVASSIQGTDSTLTDMEEIFKTQRDEIKASLSLLVSAIDETGRDSTAKLELISEFLEKNVDSIKSFDLSSQASMTTLAEMIEKAAEKSAGHLDSIATNLETAATNLGDNGESLDAIVNKIEGNNGDLNFILKNMTTDVSASILNGLVNLQSELKSTGDSLVGSMDGGNDKLVASLAQLEKLKDTVASGLSILTSATETSGLDTKTGLASVADNILSSITALQTELVSGLTSGSTKMATAIDGTKTSLNTIKQSLDTQNSKLDTGLSLVATNVAKSGSDSKAGSFKAAFSFEILHSYSQVLILWPAIFCQV